MNVLIVGDTNRWLNTVRNILPHSCTVRICRDEVDAFVAQEEPGSQFDLLILANHLSRKDGGLTILREARESNETNPIIIYSDLVCEHAKSEIARFDGIYLSERNDGVDVLAAKVKELLHLQ